MPVLADFRQKLGYNRFTLGVLVLVGVLAGVLLISIHAAGTFISIEAENGNNTGAASVQQDSQASGGGYLHFGQ